MLEVMRHRGPDDKGVFGEGEVSLGHNLLSIVGTGRQPFYGCEAGFAVVCNGEIYNYREVAEKLKGHTFQTTTDNEVIVHLIEGNYSGDLAEAVKRSLVHLDGDYAFAVYYGGDVVLARDPLGVKPLYLGKGCFASERKPLWSIGREAVPLKPGRVIQLGGRPEEGIDFRSYERVVKRPVEELCKALTAAVEKRTRDVKVGLLFSGGLDSSLLGKIVEELGREAVLYTVGLEGCRDFEYAEKASDFFGSELKCRVIKEEDLPDYARRVIYAIEEYNPMKVSVGIPLYVACEAAKKDGLKVVIAGQGADELFAGYKRYLRASGAGLEEELLRDIERIAEVNLQRDDAIAMANSLELRVPYLDREVVGIALGLPADYKIKDGRRKHILRLAARKKGLPGFIVERGKKAVQYSTGVEKALRMLAKENDNSVEGYLKSIYEELFPWR
jgi:asparagine synthase (glutamine-hydrolysing)